MAATQFTSGHLLSTHSKKVFFVVGVVVRVSFALTRIGCGCSAGVSLACGDEVRRSGKRSFAVLLIFVINKVVKQS